MEELDPKQQKKARQLLEHSIDPSKVTEDLQLIDDRVEVLETTYPKLEKSISTIESRIEEVKKMEGPKGEKGNPGENGLDGISIKGDMGEKGDKGDSGLRGEQGPQGEKGQDGLTGESGKEGSPDTPEQVTEKINISSKLIKKEKVEGLSDLDRMVKENASHQLYTGVTETRVNELISKHPTSSGSGDVVGPASAVDSDIAVFDTTTGKLIKDSGKKTSDFQVAGSYVPTSRTISTTAPLSGGGDMSADRTLTTSMNTNRLIGRGTSGTGVMEEIIIGSGLSLSGTTLSATGGGGGMAIGGAVSSGTAGSVLFIDGSGNLAQDNGNFFYNPVTKQFGIGTNTPAGSLDVYSTPMVQLVTTGQTYDDSTNYPGRDASKMFDGIITTDNDGWITNGVNTNSWGSIQFSSSKTVTLIKVLNGQPGSANRGIQHGKFEASNDGITWTKIPAIGWEDGAVQYNTDEFTLANQVTSYQTVQFSNTTAYTYYRIYGYDNYGDAYLGVLEMLMYSSLSPVSTLAVVKGMVGVGTNNPISALHVYSTTSSSTLPFAGGSGAFITMDNGTSGKGIISYSSAQMDFIPSTTVPDVGLRLVPFSLIGTSDAFFQIFAASGGYAILEGGSGLGMVVETASTTPVIFRPNRVERMRVSSNGRVNMNSLPTSSAGLSAGDLWSNGGVINIV